MHKFTICLINLHPIELFDFWGTEMDEQDIQQLAEETRSLIEKNKELVQQHEEVFAELRQAMAEQLGCSIWDLENLLERDLPAEERQDLEAKARELLAQAAPAMSDFEAPEAPPASSGGGMPVPGVPRPRRRMI